VVSPKSKGDGLLLVMDIYVMKVEVFLVLMQAAVIGVDVVDGGIVGVGVVDGGVDFVDGGVGV